MNSLQDSIDSVSIDETVELMRMCVAVTMLSERQMPSNTLKPTGVNSVPLPLQNARPASGVAGTRVALPVAATADAEIGGGAGSVVGEVPDSAVRRGGDHVPVAFIQARAAQAASRIVVELSAGRGAPELLAVLARAAVHRRRGGAFVKEELITAARSVIAAGGSTWSTPVAAAFGSLLRSCE